MTDPASPSSASPSPGAAGPASTSPAPTSPASSTPAEVAEHRVAVASPRELADAVLTSVGRAVVGNDAELRLALAAILAGGHVLLEDEPGLGKTLAARSLAQALGLGFARAQFTPDLLPGDLTGSFLYDPGTREFVFREGPVFTQLLLGDEINRTPPKTQSALLEAMQERQVTVDGRTFALPAPFHVVATANPSDHDGTYPLPAAQLDRFLVRLSFGTPTEDAEWEVVRRRVDRRREEQEVPRVTDARGLLVAQAVVEQVDCEESVGRYAVALAAATRTHPAVATGASPRGSLALVLLGRALAAMAGRDFVVPDDVRDAAVPALAHRITLRPELWMANVDAASVVAEAVADVPVPGSRE